MYKQLFVGGNMNRYSNFSNIKSYEKTDVNRDVNSVNYNQRLYTEHYSTMDLCSQAQMSENADNILNRMDKLRAFAREQQAKRLKSQRQQISFCF
jgi:predicted membrane-bound mannosyltransferase